MKMVKIKTKMSPSDMSEVDISPKVFAGKGVEGRFGFSQYFFLEDVEHKLVPEEPSACLRKTPGLVKERVELHSVLFLKYLSCCHGYGSNVMGDFKCKICS